MVTHPVLTRICECLIPSASVARGRRRKVPYAETRHL